jgi:hypothetical protein
LLYPVIFGRKKLLLMVHKFNFNPRRYSELYPYAMLGIICLATGVRLLGLNKGIWLDEYSSIKVITSDNFVQMVRLDIHPLLFYLFHKIWSQLNTSEAFLRLISVLFGIGTVILMMLWIKMYSRLASLIAGILFASLPILLRYSQEIRGYPILLFFTVCSFYFATRLVSNPKRAYEYFGLTISLTLVVSTQLVGIMLVPAVAVYILSALKDLRKTRLGLALTVIAVPCFVFAYFFLIFLLDLPDKTNWWIPSFTWQYSIITFKYMLGISFLFGPSKILANYAPGLVLLYELIITLLLAGFFFSMIIFGGWRRSLPLLIAAVIYWLQVSMYSIFVTPIFFYHTLLPGLVPFIGFIAVQIATIRLERIKTAAIAGVIIVTMMFITGWILFEAWIPVENWRPLVQVLEKKREPGDVVIFYPDYAEGPVRYYYPDLPSDSSIAIELNTGNQIPELVSLFEENKQAVEEASKHTFFVTRGSAFTLENSSTYRNLLVDLESNFGEPIFSLQYGNLSISTYQSNDH